MNVRVYVERGSLAEAVHEVDAVVVDAAGNICFSAGDPDGWVCLRSAAKPVQALAVVESGAADAFGFGAAERALMCASHNGESVHVERAAAMLRAIGCSEQDLECGVHPPADANTAAELARIGVAASALHNNCSGKHAGMLALARHLGVETHGYTAPDHLVQRTIRRQLESLTGVRDVPIAVDGCSAVTFYLPLRAIALVFRDLLVAHDAALASLSGAMMEHPYLVGGRERFDTTLMQALPGSVVSKVGAEALQCIGIRSATGEVYGVAVKARDGQTRGSEPAAIAVLEKLGLLDDVARASLASFAAPIRTNHRGLVVGRVRAAITD